ncbi:hypothetical protein BO71DRAFT_401961 [Aspergillus ellipticus CBS 707.79]|uniref:AB hydrolase-1 domain-containing protein n=1 Tax=Aspergillus ellipticus CBS 707.79 TaxID=1448320 RepID=A0A319EID9_9EURO|nr:hypothetical protein BO71DRAFT_401961 [Aspergillus ellipticus CBS 707.79]
MAEYVPTSIYDTSSRLSQHHAGNIRDIQKRRLLLVYVHGFKGSDTTFQHFPAHVHDVLTGLLGESHLVYSRVYPQYETRGDMQTAVDHFSTWLSPHEAEDLDIILLGHSLGGILAADAALLPQSTKPTTESKHRILGLVNFDVPFLGLNPRVYSTSISSFFLQKNFLLEDDPTHQFATASPNYVPPVSTTVHTAAENDGVLSLKKRLRQRKKSEHKSLVDRFAPSLKFANCLNDFTELRRRYQRLMELEAAEDSPIRIRFVNYYTESTGETAKVAASDSSPVGSTVDLNSRSSSNPDSPVGETTAQKLRRFTVLPSKSGKDGNDSLWVPVRMEDMDEVTAHQSMFFPHGARYDRLVGDTVSQIENWVQSDLDRQWLLRSQEQ